MITSTKNDKVKNVNLLNAKSKARMEQGVFVIEGTRLFFDTPDHLIKEVYATEKWLQENGDKITDTQCVEEVTPEVLSAMSDTKSPQGVVAIVKKPQHDLDLTKGLFLVLETLQDPGNMGTIFRTAEGAGVSGIIMNSTCVDIYSPKVVRSTMGSIYRMPNIIVPDLLTTVSHMKNSGVHFAAAHLGGHKIYTDVDYTKDCGFFIGNEGNGLSEELTALADDKIIIPMGGKLESLNAAMAAGILMYEAARQRRG